MEQHGGQPEDQSYGMEEISDSEREEIEFSDCPQFVPQFYRPALCMMCCRTIAEHFEHWKFVQGADNTQEMAKFVNEKTGETILAKTKYQVRRKLATGKQPETSNWQASKKLSFASAASSQNDAAEAKITSPPQEAKDNVSHSDEGSTTKYVESGSDNVEESSTEPANLTGDFEEGRNYIEPESANSKLSFKEFTSEKKVIQSNVDSMSQKSKTKTCEVPTKTHAVKRISTNQVTCVQGLSISHQIFAPETVSGVTFASPQSVQGTYAVNNVKPVKVHKDQQCSATVDTQRSVVESSSTVNMTPVIMSEVSRVEPSKTIQPGVQVTKKEFDDTQTTVSAGKFAACADASGEGKKTAVRFSVGAQHSRHNHSHSHCTCGRSPKPPPPPVQSPSDTGHRYIYAKYAKKRVSNTQPLDQFYAFADEEATEIPSDDEDEFGKLFESEAIMKSNGSDDNASGKGQNVSYSKNDLFVDDPAFVDLMKIKREYPEAKFARVWQHLPSFMQTAWYMKDIADRGEGAQEPKAAEASFFRDDSVQTPADSPTRVISGILVLLKEWVLFLQPNVLHPGYGVLEWVCPIDSLSSVHIQRAEDSSIQGRAFEYLDLSPNMCGHELPVAHWAEWIETNGPPESWEQLSSSRTKAPTSVKQKEKPRKRSSIISRAFGKGEGDSKSLAFMETKTSVRPKDSAVASLLLQFKTERSLPEYVIRYTSLALSSSTGALMQGVMEKLPTEEHHLLHTTRQTAAARKKRSSFAAVKAWKPFKGNTWKKRYFFLKEDRLEYHNLPKDTSSYSYGQPAPPSSEQKGSISLDAWTEVYFLPNEATEPLQMGNSSLPEEEMSNSVAFGVRTSTSHHIFRVANSDLARTWVRRIISATHLANYKAETPQTVIFRSVGEAQRFFDPLEETVSIIKSTHDREPTPPSNDTTNDRVLAERLSQTLNTGDIFCGEGKGDYMDDSREPRHFLNANESSETSIEGGTLWEYLVDETNEREGPCDEFEMKQLFHAGVIDNSTLARCLTYIPAVDYNATNRDNEQFDTIFLPVEKLFCDDEVSPFTGAGEWVSAYNMEVQYQRLIIEAVEVGLPFNTVTEVVNNMREKRVAPDLAVLMDNLKAQENSSRDQSE